MDAESERIYDRMTLHRLMQEHPEWKSIQLAEEIGRSSRWVRKWVARFTNEAEQSFKMYLSQSRAPKSRPNLTSEAVKDIICGLRETLSARYNRSAGPGLIAHYLRKHPPQPEP